MGETRGSFRRTNNWFIVGFGSLAVAAYLLGPYTDRGIADGVVDIAGFIALIAIFVRFLW